MATVKVKFRPSTTKGKEGSLYYQVIHNRVIRQIKSKHRLFIYEWDEHFSEIIVSSLSDERERYLFALRDLQKWDLRIIREEITNLSKRHEQYSTDDIVTAFESHPKAQTLFNFTQELIVRFKELNKLRTSETYSATLRSFMKFRAGEDLSLNKIDSDLIERYEAYLKSSDLTMNTLSFYLRVLRAIYNRAVEKDITNQSYPFKHVYTGVDKTLKRASPLKTIKKIKDLDLSHSSSLDYARDMFLFSFYTRGMSFVDMAYLKKSNLKDHILSYRRRKTNQQLHIKWENCMQEIVDKYDTSSSQYLLQIITDSREDERRLYKNALTRVNIRLKDIARMVDLSMTLSMYVARHSWASIAKSQNVPISVISEGMGHDSETTTQIYLASLDTSVLDNANSMIIKLI